MSQATTTPEKKLVFTIRDFVSLGAVILSIGIAIGGMYSVFNRIDEMKATLDKTSTDLDEAISETTKTLKEEMGRQNLRIETINERLSRLEGSSGQKVK